MIAQKGFVGSTLGSGQANSDKQNTYGRLA